MKRLLIIAVVFCGIPLCWGMSNPDLRKRLIICTAHHELRPPVHAIPLSSPMSTHVITPRTPNGTRLADRVAQRGYVEVSYLGALKQELDGMPELEFRGEIDLRHAPSTDSLDTVASSAMGSKSCSEESLDKKKKEKKNFVALVLGLKR